MPNPKTQRVGKPHLARDGQQWIYDYILQQSGLPFHWQSERKSDYPKGVRSQAMISKHLGREAQVAEHDARDAEERGDRTKALELYFDSCLKFMRAQHTIFELNAEKFFLYEGLRRAYDKVIELSPYRIERIEVGWNGTAVTGFLHLCPGVEMAPLVFFSQGCDATCEMWPNPLHNEAHERGMHVFSFDGPGLGQSNMRGIALTADNYGQATSAVLDQLVDRPEIDSQNIVMYGGAWGSYGAIRAAANDHRFSALVTNSSYTDKYYLMNEEGPRWKQLFAFLTQSATEAELDKVMSEMTLDGYMERIECPTLMVAGEYDLRDPIEEVFGLFDQLRVPSELWVFADMFHLVKLSNGPTVRELMLDWGCDRLADNPVAHPGQVIYVEPGDEGPMSPNVKLKRRWFEESL